jgi:hypothetical protein
MSVRRSVGANASSPTSDEVGVGEMPFSARPETGVQRSELNGPKEPSKTARVMVESGVSG